MLRLVSGLALSAFALGSILFLPIIGLRIVATVVATLAAHEYLEIVGAPLRAIVLAIVMCWIASGPGLPPADLLLTMALLWVAAEVLFADRSLHHAIAGIFSAVYIGLPMGLLVGVQVLQGWKATFLLLGTIVFSDSAQYYAGRTFGRRPLAPAISPKKTIEGAIGGLVVGTAFMMLVGSVALPFAGYGQLLVLGVLVVVLGICGDLFESRLKRAADMKDSSSLIPGHGGVLDRIDALLFAVAPFYLYVRNIS